MFILKSNCLEDIGTWVLLNKKKLKQIKPESMNLPSGVKKLANES